MNERYIIAIGFWAFWMLLGLGAYAAVVVARRRRNRPPAKSVSPVPFEPLSRASVNPTLGIREGLVVIDLRGVSLDFTPEHARLCARRLAQMADLIDPPKPKETP